MLANIKLYTTADNELQCIASLYISVGWPFLVT